MYSRDVNAAGNTPGRNDIVLSTSLLDLSRPLHISQIAEDRDSNSYVTQHIWPLRILIPRDIVATGRSGRSSRGPPWLWHTTFHSTDAFHRSRCISSKAQRMVACQNCRQNMTHRMQDVHVVGTSFSSAEAFGYDLDPWESSSVLISTSRLFWLILRTPFWRHSSCSSRSYGHSARLCFVLSHLYSGIVDILNTGQYRD